MIKKFLPIIICFILYHSIPACSQNSGNYDTQNYQSSYNSDCTDYPALTKVENNVLGKTFQNENIYLRVNRLESKLLGAAFPQEALCDRIDRIYKVASNEEKNSSKQANAQNFNMQHSMEFPMQSMFSSCNSNSSYDNNFTGSSNNGSAVSQLLNMFTSSFLSGTGGMNSFNNSYSNGPGYQREINRAQNVNFGTGVRIIP